MISVSLRKADLRIEDHKMRKKQLRPETSPMNFRYEKRKAELLRRLCGMKQIYMSDIIGHYLDQWLEEHQHELPDAVVAEVEAAAI